MVRMQVQLTEAQISALKKLAAERGVSVAELIRRSVDRELTYLMQSERRLHVERLRARVRTLAPGGKDLGLAHDRHLRDAFGRDGDVR